MCLGSTYFALERGSMKICCYSQQVYTYIMQIRVDISVIVLYQKERIIRIGFSEQMNVDTDGYQHNHTNSTYINHFSFQVSREILPCWKTTNAALNLFLWILRYCRIAFRVEAFCSTIIHGNFDSNKYVFLAYLLRKSIFSYVPKYARSKSDRTRISTPKNLNEDMDFLPAIKTSRNSLNLTRKIFKHDNLIYVSNKDLYRQLVPIGMHIFHCRR